METEGGIPYYGFNPICVDVNKGEKPQIRMQNSFEVFNITHSATFENIEFTGEDLMVETYKFLTHGNRVDGFEVYEEEPGSFQTPQGKLGFLPFKKCSI